MGPRGPEGPMEAEAGQAPEGRVVGAQIATGIPGHTWGSSWTCPTCALLYRVHGEEQGSL